MQINRSQIEVSFTENGKNTKICRKQGLIILHMADRGLETEAHAGMISIFRLLTVSPTFLVGVLNSK